MSEGLLPLHPVLRASGRFQVKGRASAAISATETTVLLGCGAAAAAGVLLLDFKLRLPGHAILRAVLPMALGLAAVPRRGAGTVMGSAALATAAALVTLAGASKGIGALTSLVACGPLLDVAVARAATGRRVYGAFMGAAVAANVLALLAHVAAKLAGWDLGGGHLLSTWLPTAAVTYPLCGAVAGLVSAALWFRREPGDALPKVHQ